MKVLFINPILRTAETDKIPSVPTIKDCLGFNFCKAFQELGHDVTLFAADGYRPNEMEKYPFRVIFAASKFKGLFKPKAIPFTPSLVAHILAENYDLIISSEVFGIHSLIATLIRPRRTIIWHELSHHPRLMKSIPSKMWYRFLKPIFKHCLAICPRSIPASIFLSQYFKNNLVAPIGHGVDLSRFVASESPENYFVVCSQLIPRKLVNETISKFEKYVLDFPESTSRLLIIGSGICDYALQAQVQEAGLGSKVEFLGHLDHATMIPLLSKAKAMLVSSRRDLTLLSITEALACGVPVITNSGVDYADLINAEGLGIARKDWLPEDLHHITSDLSYKTRSMAYRHNFSMNFLANQFITFRESIGQ